MRGTACDERTGDRTAGGVWLTGIQSAKTRRAVLAATRCVGERGRSVSGGSGVSASRSRVTAPVVVTDMVAVAEVAGVVEGEIVHGVLRGRRPTTSVGSIGGTTSCSNAASVSARERP